MVMELAEMRVQAEMVTGLAQKRVQVL